MITYEGAWVCAGCKDMFFQRIREGVSLVGPASTIRYAGFWIRFAAAMIDGIIMWVVRMLLAVVLLPAMAHSNPIGGLILPIVQHAINRNS